MKNKTLKYMFSVLLSVIVISCLISYIYIRNKNANTKTQLLSLANTIINENIVNSGMSENISKNEQSSNTLNSEQLANISKSEERKNIKEKEVFSVEKISQDNNVLGKIKIPKIEVEAPIKEGTTSDVLKQSVGHFSNTSYWNGNVALASHNRGTYAHYFENLDKLSLNDEIIYQTKLGTRIYVVNKIDQISEKDLSVLNNNNENTITLITCIKNKPNLRLCVKAIEKA
ncbi:MAG: class D sortase [Clostridia bacterium]|nr:class D sortase [Clostridia bacterium]